MASDRLFANDIQQAARLQSAAMNSPVYYYYFTYRGKHSFSTFLTKTNEYLGSSHGDDTMLIFSGIMDSQSTEHDREMSRVLVDIWTSFAKNRYNVKIDELSSTFFC